jgi:hypothetical protein
MARRSPDNRRCALVPLVVLPAALAVLLALVGCSGDGDGGGREGAGAGSEEGQGDGDGDAAAEQRFPDVVDVAVEPSGNGTYDFAVTISSPYDTPERYADGWRIIGEDGTVHGTHALAHDHAGEQPFTRTQSGVRIPPGVDRVIVEGHDLANGYGGRTATVTLPGR